MFRVRWECDAEQDMKALEKLFWRPYFSWLHDKLHDWSWRYGGRRWHDWLLGLRWYRAWGRRRDIYDDSWLRKQAESMKEAIDADVLEETSKNDTE